MRISDDIRAGVDAVLARMTPAQKVGQMLLADVTHITPAEVADLQLGAVLAGGDSAPDKDLLASPARWRAWIRSYTRTDAARAWGSATGGQHPIAPLFGIDAVHGNAHVAGATIYPHNIALGAADDPALMVRIGAATALETAAIGADWAYAPTVAVVRNPRWGRTYESYSEDPARVARLGAALLQGLQGRSDAKDFLAPGRHVLGSVKHFIGDGGTTDGHDQGNTELSEETLRDVHGFGYAAALPVGALNIMASYSSWHGVKMHASASLLTGVLKGRWQFPGFVVGDWNAHEQLPGCTRTDCPLAIDAGVDMLMLSEGARAARDTLLAQVNSSRLAATRVDDAVRRILTVKALMHRLDAAGPTPTAAGAAAFGSAAHRALARRAVRESLVLLKNDRDVLPLRTAERAWVLGEGADDVGMQCGGWTLDWQGARRLAGAIPGATSIHAGLRAALARGGGTATHLDDAAVAERLAKGEHPQVAVVVFGEMPYAETRGDRADLALGDDAAPHLELLRRLHAAGVPTVGVLLTGRPLWMTRELALMDALVVAWLPGSEGEGVADLLVAGSHGPRFDFTGRLPFSWPARREPVRVHDDGTTNGAAFARGFGLVVKSTT